MPAKKKPVEVSEKPKMKRGFRSIEERIAEIDKKIAFHTKAIETLEAKKAKVGTARRSRKMTYAKVLAELKASGKTPEEIMELLKQEME
jgi:septal ring factor EnvC (AmiA/AmiB activator)